MEIVKQWIPQNNLFKRHDHTTILSLLIFFILSQSHHTNLLILSILFIFIIFLSLVNSVFSSLHDKSFETDEKICCIFDELITLQHDPTVGVIGNIIGNIKSIFLFLDTFLEKIMFGLLVFCLVLRHAVRCSW